VGSAVSPIPIHDPQAASSSLSLRLPEVPISAHTKGLVIIAKRKTHIRRQHKQEGLAKVKRFYHTIEHAIKS